MSSLLRFATAPGLFLLSVFVACSSASKYDDDDSGGSAGESAATGGKGGAAGSGTAGRGQGGRSATGGSAGTAAGEAGAVGTTGGATGTTGGSTGTTGGTAGDAGQSSGGDSGANGAAAGDTSMGGDGSATGGSSTGGKGGTGGGGAGKGGTGGSAGKGGSAGGGGSGCTMISIEPLSHHLGDGAGNEGTSFSRSFAVDCSCDKPYLSFQIDGPNREKAPKISLNGTQLSSLTNFFPAVTSADVWQSNSDGSHDYNGYLQIHYDVSGKLNSGSNTFDIVSGTAADDYNFQDVRIDCGAPVDPIGPDIINRGGWVGYVADKSGDNPLGIQGSIYSYSDGVSCTVPANACATGECCISGTTLGTEPATNWGCGMGMNLNSTGGSSPVDLAYSGSATCFDIELTGDSGGNEVRMQSASYADMTGRTAPVYSLGPISGTTTKTVCFSDFACPSDAANPCSVTGSWYNLEANVVGGHQVGAFDVCIRSLVPYAG